MNTQQFQYEFGIHMNQFDSALQLSSDDIFYWLNKAQETFVISRYNGNNLLKKGFEQSQQVIDDIRVLLVKDKSIGAEYLGGSEYSLDKFFAYFGEFPDNHLFLINNRTKVAYNFPELQIVNGQPVAPYKEKVVGNRFSQSDDIFKLLSDPFNTTKPTSPLTDISEKGITVYTDKTFLAKDIIISYIRKPKYLTLTVNDNTQTTQCELPSHTYKEIIQLAVDLFLQNTRELKQRLQRETPTADKQQNIEENE